MTAQRSEKSRRRGNVRAVLAGGLVLGVGAAITLASWNDDEFATGTFTAGQFNLVGSTDGATFADHVTSPGAPLAFTLNPANLSPDDVVYAPFALRLAEDTTNDATVTLTAPSTTGVVDGLSYEVIQPTAFGCDASTTGTTLVAAGTAVGTVAGTVTFPLAHGAPATDAGDAVNLCFIVTAGALTPAQTGTATWQFHAVSS